MKVGIIKLSHLGDIIHTLPLAFLISRNAPLYEVNWIIEKNYLNIFEGISFVKKFIPFSSKKNEILNSFKLIRNQNLDLILDLQGLSKTQILSFFSSSCKRIGFSFKDLKEKYFFFLYHKKIKTDEKHIILKNLSFAKYLGIDNFSLDDYNLDGIEKDPEENVFKFLKSLNSKNFGILNPFSSSNEKDFPVESLKNLIKVLKEKKIELVLTYGPGQENRAKEIEEYLSILKAPLFSVNEMAFLIKKSSFFIGPDTGFYHIADSFRIPSIGYFFWYPPERNGNFFGKGLCYFKKELKTDEMLKFLEENCFFS